MPDLANVSSYDKECGYSAKAKASDAGFPVCKHEGAKNESFVNAE